MTRTTSLITGGASGIGRELCRRSAALGRVVVADLDHQGAEAVASTIRADGGEAWATALDVTDAETVEAVVDEVWTRHGRLDRLFNNAGITVVGEVRDLDLDDWNRVLDVNLRGVVNGVHAAYPRMVDQGSGQIVNTASGYGLIAGPANLPYVASKFAVVGLSLGLRDEGADLGVGVSVVCPGLVATPILTESTTRQLSLERMVAAFPVPPISAVEAAEQILRGVARNRAVIAFPAYVRWSVRLQCLAPWLIRRLNRRTMARWRRHRGGIANR